VFFPAATVRRREKSCTSLVTAACHVVAWKAETEVRQDDAGSFFAKPDCVLCLPREILKESEAHFTGVSFVVKKKEKDN
jgi:hypothetical protein